MAWTVSGPMTSVVVGRLGSLSRDPVLPPSPGSLLLRLADRLDKIKTQWALP